MSLNARHRLFSAAFRLIAATRADRWLRPLAQGAGVILTFHHVRPWRERAFAPNRLLEITPAFLDRTLAVVRQEGFEVIALDEVPERLRRGGGRPFAALTFDDGYRDNRDHAWPVLKRHGAPWTLFATTDYVDGRGRLWWLELEQAVSRLDRVVLTDHGLSLDLPTRTAPEKQAAFDAVYGVLRAGPEERLRTAVAALARQAGVDMDRLASTLCLDWQELEALAREPDVTIGAHTLTHPMLAKHDETAARREIVESKAILERRLGRPVRHLAYPVGDATSAGPRDFRLAREAGFATAVTTRPGHLAPLHAQHLHALPRVSVNGLHQSESALRALLSGVPFLAWNRGRIARIAA